MIETGDVILVSSNTLQGVAIQEFQKIANRRAGKWNHTGVILVEEGITYVIEALNGGVKKTNFEDEYFSGKNGEYMILKPLFDNSEFAYGKFLNQYINKSKYDWWNTLFFQPIKILFGIWIGPKRRNNKFECAELVYFTCKCVNPTLFPRNPEELAPYQIFLDPNFLHLQKS